MNSIRISHAWLKVTESFSVSPTHRWLFDVMVMTPDLKSVGCDAGIFVFWKEKPSLISLILNTKSEKHKSATFDGHRRHDYINQAII